VVKLGAGATIVFNVENVRVLYSREYAYATGRLFVASLSSNEKRRAAGAAASNGGQEERG